MTRDHEPITDEQVDSYVDGLMEPAEREAFEGLLRTHPEIVRVLEQQAQIDASLARLFPPAQISLQQLSERLATSSPAEQTSPQLAIQREIPPPGVSRARRVAMVGLAASLTWAVVVWQLGLPWQHGSEPAASTFFAPRPLAIVYQEAIENGFEPYYECRQADRFAATFLRRQGRALKLATLPVGSRMLGLSYAGGLSRETTAMLCEVDSQPVIVFVDRLANDSKIAADQDADDIYVHRAVKDECVFYEVSPFNSARIIDYLVFP